MLGMKIIKFSLQPLVENAIYHGIEKSPEKGLIEIGAAIERDKLIITVSNNGIPIEKERLTEIQNLLDNDITDLAEYELKTDTIGIYNIHMRLRLNFGKDYGLSINSDNENGTVVKLKFPF
jgi:two-component system sensor histidine kinase YesM